MLNRCLFFLCLGLTVSSCISTSQLYKGLNLRPATLSYLHDSDLSSTNKVDSIQVALPVFADPDFTRKGTLKKTRSQVAPLILINIWEKVYQFDIGSDQIKEDAPQFIRESILFETNRSTSIFADSSKVSDLVLDVKIDTFRSTGDYIHEGVFIFFLVAFAWQWEELIDPGTAHTSMSYTLRSGQRVLLEGRVSHRETLEFPRIPVRDKKRLRLFLSISLAEGLSLCIKANVEQISREVEDYLAF
ncbi:MAG: hypothetical protein GVX96_04785 [Bacteroidetes bacterium]|jgi:hypothetical protein|nr:hypothetical protein [Bacteroidota bacterium]